MEENSLIKKIRRQGQLVSQQVEAFRRSFQFKNVNHLHFAPYLQALQKVFNLNYSYGIDYFQFVPKAQLQQILNNNKTFINDLTSKFKFLLSLMNKSQVKTLKVQQSNMCDICKQDKMVKNIQKAKQIVQEDISITSLRNMIKNLERESNILFSQEQDKIFYKHLHRALQVKQEIIALRDNHIQEYLQQTIKHLGEIKSIQDAKSQVVEQTPHRIDWSVKIKQQINQEFLKAFKGKIPPWVQKMFDKFMLLYKKFYFKVKQSRGIQTGQYISDEILDLRKQIEQNKIHKNQERCIREQYLQQKQNLQVTVSLLKTQIDMINQEKMNNIILLHQSKTQSMRNSIASNKPLESQGIFKRSQSKFKTQMPNSGGLTDLKDTTGRTSVNSTYNQKQNLRYETSLTEHRSSNYEILNPNKKKKNRKMTDITTLKKSYDQITGFLPQISQRKSKNAGESSNQLKKLGLKLDQFSTLSKLKKDENFQIQEIQEKQQLEELQNNLEDKFERIKSYKKRVSLVNEQLLVKRNSVQKNKQNIPVSSNASLQKSNGHKSKFAHQIQSPRAKQQRIQSSRNQHLQNREQEYSNYQYTQQQIKSSQQESKQNQSQRNTIVTDRKKQSQNQNKLSLPQSHNSLSIKSNLNRQSMKSIDKVINNNNNATYTNSYGKNNFKIKSLQVQKCIQTQNNEFYDMLKEGSNLMQKFTVQQLQSIAKKLLIKKNKKQVKKQQNVKNNLNKSQIKNKIQSKTIKRLKGLLTQNLQKNIDQQQSKNMKKSMQESLLPTNFQSLDQSIIVPQSMRPQLKQNKILTKKDFVLFLNEETAYQYEAGLKKKYHKNAVVQLSQQEKIIYKSTYSMIELIKKHSLQIYKKILAFIRYPYHTIANDFSIIDIVKQMSFQTFLQYMSRIKHFHKKCQHIQQKCHCQHIQFFIQKIQNILVDLTYENDFQQGNHQENRQKMVQKQNEEENSNSNLNVNLNIEQCIVNSQ